MAEALGRLGARRAFVIHGEGGLDEVAVRGRTRVAEWHGGLRVYELAPRDFGLAEEDPAGLAGGDAQANAAAVHAVLGGRGGAQRAAVLMEAALALLAVGAVDGLEEGARRGAAAIDGARPPKPGAMDRDEQGEG